MAEAGSITGKCPSCGVTFRVPAAMRGKRGKCPKCGEVLEVPGEATVPDQGPDETASGFRDAFSSSANASIASGFGPAVGGPMIALPAPEKASAFWLLFGILGGAALTVLIAAGGVLLWLLLRPQPPAPQPPAAIPAAPPAAAEPGFDSAVAEATWRFWEDFHRKLAILEERTRGFGSLAGPAALMEGTALRQAADEIRQFLEVTRAADRTNVDPQAIRAVDEAIQTLSAFGDRLGRAAEAVKQWSEQQQKAVLDLSLGQLPEGNALPGLDGTAVQGIVTDFAEIVRQAQALRANLSAVAEQLSARYQRPFSGTLQTTGNPQPAGNPQTGESPPTDGPR